ncbi:hypothetical protein U1Q18_012285 [Sarracenia purpurea var. burkii]
MSRSGDQKPGPHIALLPSSGMGHLIPFLRFAVSVSELGVEVTIITPHPTVSLAESQSLSRFFSTFPQIHRNQFLLLPFNDPSVMSSEDPFYVHYEAIRRSSHLLPPFLSAVSPPLSALITDMSLASTVIPITQSLSLPNYVLFTSSAKMMTLFLSSPTLFSSESPSDSDDFIPIPGLHPTPKSWIPPSLLSDTDNLLKTLIISNGKMMPQSDGILINTFPSIENETLAALNDGRVVKGLPMVTPIGPFPPFDSEITQSLAWLDEQPAGSVLYVSFGSRTAMSRDQIRELGNGLAASGCRFLWVVKEKKVDREEDAGELEAAVGEGFVERVKERGMVVKSWVSQEEVMGHRAVGGFMSHCGWNSVTEAIWHGVRVVAWPQHGDQKMNAWLVERIGLGKWERGWGWGGERVVTRKEIREKVREVMGDELMKVKAERIREEARRAVGNGGSSKMNLIELVRIWENSYVA